MNLMNNNQSQITMAREVKLAVNGLAQVAGNMLREAGQYLKVDQQQTQHLEAASEHRLSN